MTVKSLCWKSAPAVSRVISLDRLISLTGQRRILPFYHTVSDRELPWLAPVIRVRNTSQFLADLDFFLKHFLPVDVSGLMPENRQTGSGTKPVFHLSFDDGLKECVTTIAPILFSKGIPATFFINTAFIGNRDLFFRFKACLITGKLNSLSEGLRQTIHAALDRQAVPPGTLQERLLMVNYVRRKVLDEIGELTGFDLRDYAAREEIYMSEEDIRSLHRQGFSIGSHSEDHPAFGMTDLGEQLRQTFSSLDVIREKFGVTKALFSFPFSDEGVSAQFFRKVYKPEGKADLTFGISGLKKDLPPLHLHRIPMEAGPFSARQIITGEYLYYCLKSVIHKNKIHRK
jgi:peptidoglycan/xylan/chitin deacetylase (PgdA/CDA1 family)